ncbi:hypothetical protein BJP25_01230 [Actinokineospora bangkokensis]|uniref:Uncharacterized protein n=2 Tax=Actinokineospora bangkokensis TaxID=1193682 RepID=A0A1Q9LCD6_9PSEU|nr:hypothetical protein BJP25_01230 [Actinokineospora bangkokensis]
MAAEPPKRSTGLWIALSLLLVALVGATVWLVVETSTSGRRSAPPVVDESLTQVVTATDGRTRIRVPSNWRELPGDVHQETATIEFGHLVQERYLTVLPWEKADYADFAAFEEQRIVELDGAGALTAADQGTPLRVGGREAVRYELTGKVGGHPVVYWDTLVDGERGYYEVLTWTLAERRADAEPVLADVVATFEEITP